MILNRVLWFGLAIAISYLASADITKVKSNPKKLGKKAVKHSEDKPMLKEKTIYHSLLAKSRAEIIKIAQQKIESELGPVNFGDYPIVLVEKNSISFQISFKSNLKIDILEAKPNHLKPNTATISIHTSAEKDLVLPGDRQLLYSYTDEFREIAKMFALTDDLTLREQTKEYFLVRVTYTQDGGATFAWDEYKIDRTTREKTKVSEHHPIPLNVNRVPDRVRYKDPYVEVVE